MLAGTIFYNNSLESYARAERLTYSMRLFAQEFFYNFYIISNVFLCIDLYLMMSRPFESKEKRYRYYYTASFVFGLFCTILYVVQDYEDYAYA